ncbi:MAG: hypothetical protein JWM88_2305 [Verrucomicrobia bacterium]|nr:hypothetical protein [Verrucomicrobiota bacterium]
MTATSPTFPIWSAFIETDAEPAVLSRLLQKLTCQHATILRLEYQFSPGAPFAEIAIAFAAESSRAHLLAKQWETLVPVRRVRMSEGFPTPK